MKISRTWLERFFDTELPSTEELAEALTFHAFEIEEAEGDMLDVKVLPDRAAYALSHRGIAREVSAILGIPMKEDPLRTQLPEWIPTNELSLSLDPEGKTYRKMGALVRGVKVGPSPEWLRAALESVGQRSINNVVDATNFVTLNMGQPLHAFDAGKIAWHDGVLSITVRAAEADEQITVLTGETYTLPEGALVIAEGEEGTALDIAGIKGGMASAITEETDDLFVSVCNFYGARVRKTAQALNLFTDASTRFQNKISPELAAYGMRDVLALITELADGEVVGVNDVYPNPVTQTPVSVTRARITGLLGSEVSDSEVRAALEVLDLPYTSEGNAYTVTPPFERRDLTIAEDLIEEVGRIRGYDKVVSQPLLVLEEGEGSPRYDGLERIKDVLRERGYTEISTQSFAERGDIILANPLDKTKPALRKRLAENMEAALVKAVAAAPRVLGPAPAVHLFEIGSVFPKEGETLSLALGYRAVSGKQKAAVLDEVVGALKDELGIALPVERVSEGIAEILLKDLDLAALGEGYVPARVRLGSYHPFTIYPFALRDVAVWTPHGTEESEVTEVILKEAGEHLVRIDLFDRFEKEGRVSYAFRLVFESAERTLSDEELVPAMARIAAALAARAGWEVR